MSKKIVRNSSLNRGVQLLTNIHFAKKLVTTAVNEKPKQKWRYPRIAILLANKTPKNLNTAGSWEGSDNLF